MHLHKEISIQQVCTEVNVCTSRTYTIFTPLLKKHESPAPYPHNHKQTACHHQPDTGKSQQQLKGYAQNQQQTWIDNTLDGSVCHRICNSTRLSVRSVIIACSPSQRVQCSSAVSWTTFWILRLNTRVPGGMNLRDDLWYFY